MTEILTKKQKMLARYLDKVEGMSKARLMHMMAILWDNQATQEMQDYINETKDSNLTTLLQTALTISQKYKPLEGL